MSYKYNPLTRQPDRVQNLSAIEEDIDFLQGKASLSEIYVATTGSDDTGDGSIENPFATILKAYSFVPKELNTSVVIKVANGTYTSVPEVISHTFGAQGQLTFDGYELPTVEYSGLTVTNITALGLDMVEITVSAGDSTWEAEELYGKFAYVRSGGELDSCFPIHKNASTTFVTKSGSLGGMLIGDTFDIVEAGVLINTSHPITFHGDSPRNFMCQLGAYNMSFEYVGEDIGVDCLVLSGTTAQFYPTCQFVSEVGLTALSISGGGLNGYSAVYPEAFSCDKGQWWVGLAFLKNGTQVMGNKVSPPTGVQTLVNVTTVNHGFSGTSVNFICTRGNLALYGTKVSVNNCAVESFQLDHGCYSTLSVLYVDAEYSSYNIRVDDFSNLEMAHVYFRSATTKGFSVETSSSITIEDTGSIEGIEPTYMFYVHSGCFVEVLFDPTIGGITNDIYFARSATGHAYPSVGNNVNDSERSYYIR